MLTKLCLAAPVAALILAGGAAVAAEKEYRVGYIADLSGPMQDSYGPLNEAAGFYVRALNERGGVNGIPVKLIVRNDQLDATRASSLVLELATSENVNSIWGMSVTRTHMAVYQQAQRHKVPAIAQFSGIKEVLPPQPLPFAYSIGHVFEVAGEVSGKLASKLLGGKGKIVCVSIESPGGVAVCDFAEGAAAAGGVDGGTVLFPPPTAEFAAIGQKMAAMGPSMVVAHVGAGMNVGITRALRSAGYTGPILMGSHGLNETPLIDAVKEAGYTEQLMILSRFASPDEEGKELDELRAAAEKYGKADPISTTSIMGWVLGMVMEQSLAKCGWPCPGEKLDGVIRSSTFDTGALMGGPITFSPNDHYGPSWWRVYKYRDGKFLPTSDWIEASSSPSMRKQK